MNDLIILKNFLNNLITKLDNKNIDDKLLNELKIFFINTELNSNYNNKELIEFMFYGFYIKNLIN